MFLTFPVRYKSLLQSGDIQLSVRFHLAIFVYIINQSPDEPDLTDI